jgi:CHASE2 domain-containing sensor protein
MDPSLRTIIFKLQSEWRMVAPTVRRNIIAVVAGILPYVLLKTGVGYSLDPLLLRSWFYLRGNNDTPRTVTIVRLDKPAYSKIGLSPGEMFPRKYLAEGLRKITAAGAKVIIIDGIAQRPTDKESDEAFAKALSETPTIIGRASEIVIDTDANGVQRRRKVLHKSIDSISAAAKDVMQTEVRMTGGVVEEICLSNIRETFSDEKVPLLPQLRRFVSPDLKEPGDFDFINFYGPPSTLSSISIGELIGDSSKVDPAYFRDRVVFIGSHSDAGVGAEAGKDSFRTSISSSSMYGVEIHATIAANLMDGSWIKRMTPGAEGAVLGIAALITTYVIFGVGMFTGFAVAVGAMLGWLGFSFYSFVSLHNFVPAISYCLIIGLFVVLRWALAAIFGAKSSKKSGLAS